MASVHFQIRRDTEYNWLNAPQILGRAILLEGEQGLNLDNGQFKIGDGVTPWANLPYYASDVHGSGNLSGNGTTNYIPLWSAGNLLDSNIYESAGKIGINTTNTTHDLTVNGTFSAISKSFNIPHPTKKDQRLVYGSLESPYHGIRLTGKAITSKGTAVVKLPDYIKKLVHSEDCTVQLTNYKHGKVLFVEKIDIAKNTVTIKVAEPEKDEELEFFWDLTAIRKDIPHLVVEQ